MDRGGFEGCDRDSCGEEGEERARVWRSLRGG